MNVWHLDTGKHLAKYTNNWNHQAVTCVDYHPYNHILAFSSFGGPTSVRVLKFSKTSSGKDVGLKIMRNEPNKNESGLSYRGERPAPVEGASNRIPIPDEEMFAVQHSFAARSWKRTNRLHHIIEKIDKMLFVMKLRRIQYPVTGDTDSDLSKEMYHAKGAKERRKRFHETKFSVNYRPVSSIKSFNLPLSDEERRRMNAKERLGNSDDSLDKVNDRVRKSTRLRSRGDDSFSQFAVNQLEDIAQNDGGKAIWRNRQSLSSESSNSAVISIDTANVLEIPRGDMSDSASTYVIDAIDCQEGAGENADSKQQFASDYIIDVETNEPMNEVFGTGENSTSTSSHATFTIENESSNVLKSRRNLQQDV